MIVACGWKNKDFTKDKTKWTGINQTHGPFLVTKEVYRLNGCEVPVVHYPHCTCQKNDRGLPHAPEGERL